MTALKKIALCALLALSAPVCRADATTPPTDLLDKADTLARSGEWEKARQLYKEQLAAKDPATLPSSFFFNYGTILARAGAAGEAYVTLLRAAFSSPYDSDTKHNLRLAEAQVPAAVRAVQPASWLAWWPNSLRTLPWKLWIALALASSAAAFALARLADRSFTIAAGALSLALFAWGGLAWSQTRLPVYGAVTIAKVKSGPGTTFTDITTLEPGTLVSEETSRDGWLKIRFVKPEADEESVGWVEPTAVLRVF